jgi:acyl carrier protein
MMKILQELERFILTEVAVDLDKTSLGPDEDLLEQGIIDSLGVMTLIAYIEQNFGVEVTDEDVVPENFQTLRGIAAFIQRIASTTVSSLAV